jgi:hypothetical protein
MTKRKETKMSEKIATKDVYVWNVKMETRWDWDDNWEDPLKFEYVVAASDYNEAVAKATGCALAEESEYDNDETGECITSRAVDARILSISRGDRLDA